MTFSTQCKIGSRTSDDKQVQATVEWLEGNYYFDYEENTDFITPTILVPVGGEGSEASIFTSNYVRIGDSTSDDFLHRYKYYNIVNIESVGDKLIRLTLDLDDLMTYYNELMNTEVIVSRNENDFNLYLKDNVFTPVCYPLQSTIVFPYGFSDTETYILNTTGKRG